MFSPFEGVQQNLAIATGTQQSKVKHTPTMQCNANITTHSFSTNDMLKPISAHFGYKSFGVFAGIMVCILPRYHNGTLLVCAALPNGRDTLLYFSGAFHDAPCKLTSGIGNQWLHFLYARDAWRVVIRAVR